MDPQAAARNIRNPTTWQRLVFMVLFAVILNVVDLVLLVFVVVQFLFKAVTGRLFENARGFAQSLSTYVYEIALFLTYRSDILPWPFSRWPGGPPEERDETAEPSFNFGSADSTDDAPRPRRRGTHPGANGSGGDSAAAL